MSDDDLPEDDDAPVSAVTDDRTESVAVSGRRKRENRIEREARESASFWKAVLADPVGRRELWRVIVGSMGAHAFETRFPASPAGTPDPYATWYAKGEQDLGLRLYHQWLRLDHAAVHLMHVENDPRFAPPRERRRPRVP